MAAVIAIGLAGVDVLAGLPPLLLTAGAAGGLLWWLTRRGWGHGWWKLFTGRQIYTHWESHRDAEQERTDLNLPPRRRSDSAPHKRAARDDGGLTKPDASGEAPFG